MKNSSFGSKKYRINYIASLLGVKQAEESLKRLGFASKANFAKSHLLALNTVTKFWKREPVKADSFKRICNKLQLNWEEIAEIQEEQSQVLMRKKYSKPNTDKGVTLSQLLNGRVTLAGKQNQTIQAEIALKSSINSSHYFQFIEFLFQEISGNSLKKVEIQSSSIKLIIEASQKDIQRLGSEMESAQLTEVLDFPIESVEILGESSDENENPELSNKWRLVHAIVTEPVDGRDLRDTDLSDADLSDADLSGADLSGADLSDADLSDADLSGADLSAANLSGANLSGVKVNEKTKLDQKWRLVLEILNGRFVGQDLSNANLILANLSGANLIGANLSGANLSGANLSGANLIGTNLSNAYLIGTCLSGANLSDANLRKANLSGADLSNTILVGADLSGADLISADLMGTDLSNTILGGANLIGANITKV
ncbi:pentapeptide repeat-containing protein [Aetokthonos hydrillicola Thurmond2011]|uniref:Pentapeptide repeat-containing protein n=1 Tax=Aetokthonos hydrillicola Thurmond2011 TaxID=2712845 RepID=A0AAP5IGL0_9CYAN|nr:pentapeptide repeat-containing protein [Aetokthonos hydrillicola]MDR9899922.1 pentapeptide repeat-containing protein [Aetokthonos hydrillicola Thurmond2011]